MARSNIVELRVQHQDTAEVLLLKGHGAWTPACLIEAGESGITPIERPAPRWSGYVPSLRKRGLAIDTLDERHAGPYSGRHGRYVLRTVLTVLSSVTAKDKRHPAAQS